MRTLLKVNINPLKLNLLSISVYRDYAIFTVFSIVYWYYEDNYLGHYILSSVDVGSIYFAYIASFIFMLLFVIYLTIAIPLFKALSSNLPNENQYGFLYLLKIYTWILVAFLIYNFIKSPPVLLFIGSVNALEISELRYEGSANPFFRNLKNYWIPILSYTWLYIYLVNNNFEIRNRIKFYLLLSITMAIISATWVMAKSMLASYLLGLIGVYIASTGNKINFRKAMFALFSVVVIILIAYMITLWGTEKANFDYISTLFLHRLFTQATGVIYSFYVYPNLLDFKGLSGISNVLASLNDEKFSSVYGDLIDHAVPEFADISGALSSFVAGDAWGLFGWYGIFIGPLFLSFFYGLIYTLAIYDKSRVKIIFIGIYGVYFGNAFIASSFYSFLWPVGLLISIFPVLFIYLCSGLFNEKGNNIRI